MNVPQISGTMPNLRRIGVGLELGAEEELGHADTAACEKNSKLWTPRTRMMPSRREHRDDRAEDQADGDGRFPERQEAGMARPEIGAGRARPSDRRSSARGDDKSRIPYFVAAGGLASASPPREQLGERRLVGRLVLRRRRVVAALDGELVDVLEVELEELGDLRPPRGRVLHVDVERPRQRSVRLVGDRRRGSGAPAWRRPILDRHGPQLVLVRGVSRHSRSSRARRRRPRRR